MIQQSPNQGELEKKIRAEAENTPHITFGYIGNFERWGDDRKLFLWISNLSYDRGNLKDIWSCTAVDLDKAEYSSATRALKHFKLGYEAAKKEFETTQKP